MYAIADWECIDADLPYRGDHVGVCETSQLMALHPGLVDLTRQTGNEELGMRFAAGVNFTKGPLPSKEIGEKIVASQIRNLASAAKRLVAEYQPRAGWKAPDLNQTEEIWQRFDRLTRKYWTTSYAEYKTGKTTYGQIPAWETIDR